MPNQPRISMLLMLAGVGVLLAAVPVRTHHAFSAEFDPTKPVTLDGVVTKIELVNPHTWLYLDVQDADGKVPIGGSNAARPTR